MSAQIGKYTQASLDPNNTAAADQLQNAQTALNDWKQQNPRYTELSSKRDALANEIQTQIAAKAQNDLQVAQLLTTPQYVQWNGNTPPSPYAGWQIAATPDGSAPASDLSIHDVDSRAGVIAAQTGFPAGLAYASALGEAKRAGAQTLDGNSIDDAIKGIQPVAEAQLLKMTPQQLRQAFQSGLITRQQVQATVMGNPDRSGQDQAATATLDHSGQTDDLVAQSVADLTARATNLRTKIQTAFDTGGADGAKDLATYRAALADTEGQLHAATQTLLNRVPAVMQQRIAKAVAPDLDWDDATQQNPQDPMAHFATENLGSALRDQDIAPDLQQRIRRLAISRGVNPDLADHIANQAVGANTVTDLMAVLRGRNIDQTRAETLQDMGFLQQSDPNDPASPLHLTEDAQRLLPPGAQRFVQLKPDVARYTPSPDPAHGSALYQNAVAGMEHFSNTAEKMLPAPPPAQQAAEAPGRGGIPRLKHNPAEPPAPSPPEPDFNKGGDPETLLNNEAVDAINTPSRQNAASKSDPETLQAGATNEDAEEQLTKNAKDGARREKETHDQLKQQNPGKSVQRERYLRDKDGKIIRDPKTGEARRVDHAVIDREKERARTYETTGPDVSKVEQMAKETRIREEGGIYIRDQETRKIVPTEGPSQIIRRP
jgi:hypothetical protein